MFAYVVRRILATIPVMAIVALFVFSLLYIAPGDPAAVIAGDQATRYPTFDAANGSSGVPVAASGPVHRPSDPSFGQEAPPRASTVAPARTSRGPSGVSKRAAVPLHPVQRQRVRIVAPDASRRRIHARNSGEAFIATGKTRPELPTKVSMPRPEAQVTTASGPQAASIGARRTPPSE